MADPAVNVYTGAWWNTSDNVLTLTLRDKEAAILSAALVIFLGFVANNSWNIFKFILHQIRASRKTGDELHQQQQVALRNSVNHLSAFLLMTRIAFGWGIRNRQVSKMAAFERSILLTLLTLAGSVGWAAAQLFLAVAWTSAGDRFVVAPSSCGWMPRYNNITTPAGQTWYDSVKDGLTMANTYQLQCYRNQSTADSAKCGTFPVPRLKWTASEADCPFGNEGLCIATNSTPFRMDTGPINSLTHLGVLTNPQDSIDYRYTATCSPLVATRTAVKDGARFYFYGNNSELQEDMPSAGRATWWLNITEKLDTNSYYTWPFSFIVDKEFRNERQDWRPNSTMVPEDKTAFAMSIFFISAGQMFYVHENYDPVFGTKPKAGRVINGVPAYMPEQSMSILGCIEEWELCNPSSTDPSRCMMISRKSNNTAIIDRLKLNPTQAATTLILRNELDKNHFRSYVSSLSPQLSLSGGLIKGTSTYLQYLALKKDYWRTEVSRWFDINLIMVQRAFVDYVTGPRDAAAIPLLTKTEELDTTADIKVALKQACERQVVRNVTGARNFNLKAIIAVVVPGIVVVILGFTIDSLAGWAQGILRKGDRKRLLWIQDDMLQPKGVVGYKGLPAGVGGDNTSTEGSWQGGGVYTGYDGANMGEQKTPLVSVMGGGYESGPPEYDGGQGAVYAPR